MRTTNKIMKIRKNAGSFSPDLCGSATIRVGLFCEDTKRVMNEWKKRLLQFRDSTIES